MLFKKYAVLIALFLAQATYAETSVNLFQRGNHGQPEFQETLLDRQVKNVVSQKLDTSCGGAALSMLFHQKAINKSVSEEDVIRFIIQKRGHEFDSVNFDDMMEFANQNDTDSLAQFLSFDEMKTKLIEDKIPFIVRIKGMNADKVNSEEAKYQYHFVVVKGIANDLVSISDPMPNIGNVQYSKDEFLNMIDTKNGKGKVFFLLPKSKSDLKHNHLEQPQYYPFKNRIPHFIRF